MIKFQVNNSFENKHFISKKRTSIFAQIGTHLTVRSSHVTYAFQSVSTLYTRPDIVPVLSKEFLGIRATRECGLALKRVHDMIRTYSQMYRADKYSQHSSNIWPVWLSGFGFKSHRKGTHLSNIFIFWTATLLLFLAHAK